MFASKGKPTISTLILIPVVSGVLASLALLFGASTARAGAVWLVTSTNDTFDGVCDSQCTLRDAMYAASNGDIISITVNGTILLSSSMDITKSITINGPGADNLAISGNHANRVMSMSNLPVTLNGVTIRDGNIGVGVGGGIYSWGPLTLTNVKVISNTAAQGGGIFNMGGSVILVDSVVQGNYASVDGGGVYNNIFLDHPAVITLTNSQIISNTATRDGGGVVSGGKFFVTAGSSVAYNQSGRNGGGFFLYNPPLQVQDSAIHHNYAVNYGGGIYTENNRITLTQTSLVNNTAGNNGGGIYLRYAGGIMEADTQVSENGAKYGAGIYLESAAITATQTTFHKNEATDGGGGIYVNTASCRVNLSEVVLSENAATFGAGLANSSGKVRLDHTTFLSNTTLNDGAGIFSAFGVVTLTMSSLQGNLSQSGSGGGIYAMNTRMIISGTTLSENTSPTNLAGAIFHTSSAANTAALTMTNSLIRDNSSNGGGGGVFAQGTSGTCRLNLQNVTFSGNSAPNGNGGGLNNNLCNVTMNNSTFTGNSTSVGNGGGISSLAGVLVAKNSILSDNIDSNGEAPDCNGVIDIANYNLIEQNNFFCSLGGAPTGNLQGVSANLGPLADNGGPTLTHALLPGSPALDAANPAVPGSGGDACLAFDQRGKSRVSACDLGAYETWHNSYLPMLMR